MSAQALWVTTFKRCECLHLVLWGRFRGILYMFIVLTKIVKSFFKGTHIPFRIIGFEFVTWLKGRARDYDFPLWQWI